MTTDSAIAGRPAPDQRARALLWFVVLAACLVDFVLCMGLLDTNYFNDDLEQMADGAFWKSVYVTQLDVHMPLPAMISALASSVFGPSWDVNRILAAAYHLPICAIIVLWTAKLFPGRRGLVAGLAASVAWSLAHIYSWGYQNLTEVPAAMFLMLGLYFGLELEEDAVSIKRPLLLGVLFGLAGLSRIMNGLQILFLMAAMLAVAKGDVRQRLLAFAKICAGGLLPVLVMTAYFAVDGRLGDVFYFALAHNFASKSGSFHPMAWVGNVAAQDMRRSYMLAGLAALLGLRAAYSPAARLALIVAAGAVGGWLSANPTGIGDTPFHAIPAFPFFAALAALGLGAMATARHPKGDPLGNIAAWAFNLAVLAGLALWSVHAAEAYAATVRGGNAVAMKLRAQRVGAFIQQHTPPGSKIFVFGTDPQIYVTSKRDSASMASFLYNEMAQYKDKIFSQVQASRPSAIFFPKNEYWHRSDMADFPELVAYFMANYTVSDNPEVLLRLKGDEPGHDVPELTEDERRAVNAYMTARYKCAIEMTAVRLTEANPAGLTVSYAQPGVWAQKEAPFAAPVAVDRKSPVRVTLDMKTDGPPGSVIKPVRLLVDDRNGGKFWTWITQDDLKTNAGHVEVDLSRFANDSGATPSDALTTAEVGGWQDQGVSVHAGPITVQKVAQRINGRCDVH